MENSPLEFLEFVARAQLRFYQERNLGLDVAHGGLGGMLLVVAAAASLTVFLLAIFHVIARRAHVVRLLLGLGAVALILGFATSYLHYRGLPGSEASLLCPAAGPQPVNDPQRAALVGLPFFFGVATFVADVLGCLYMAAFWGAGWLSRKRETVRDP